MALVLTAPPAVEPVTLAEAKAHLRAEDTLIASLIITSRLHIEAALGLALVTQSWSYFIDAWPRGPQLSLPLRPVQSIGAVKLYAADETVTILPADTYFLDGAATPARLVRQGSLAWPKPGRTASGIEIAIIAGYGNSAVFVPAPIRQAILLLVAHWHEHREPVAIGQANASVPSTVSDLLLPYRWVRL